MSRTQFAKVLNGVKTPDEVRALIERIDSEELLRNFLELVLIVDSTERDIDKIRALGYPTDDYVGI